MEEVGKVLLVDSAQGQNQQDRKNKYVILPIQHPALWSMYTKAADAFWNVGEVDLGHDRFEFLTRDEQKFISNVLAFFAAADGIVLENLAERFMKDCAEIPEAKMFYGFQIAMENIHAHMYALLIDTYIRDAGEKDRLFDAIECVESIKHKAQWALKWISNGAKFGLRLVAFAAVEGIFFSSSFCAIYWLKKRNLMGGLCKSNELIARDEGLHCDFACVLHSLLRVEHSASPSEILAIITEATEIEQLFVEESLQVPLIGMSSSLMCQYVEFCADHLLVELGCEKHYHTPNPFEWMELISLTNKSNFFETRVTEYKLAASQERIFSMDEEF